MKLPGAASILTLALLAVVGVMTWQAAGLGTVAGRVPTPVLWVTLALLAVQALSELVPAVGRATRAYTERGTRARLARQGEPASAPTDRDRGAAGILWVAALPALALAVGLVPASFLYLLLYLRILARVGWVPSLAVSAGLGTGLYFLFERGLDLPLARGLLL